MNLLRVGGGKALSLVDDSTFDGSDADVANELSSFGFGFSNEFVALLLGVGWPATELYKKKKLNPDPFMTQC